MDPLLHSLNDSPLGQAMRDTSGLFPACEALHFVGLSLLFGSMIVVDLRIMGALRSLSYEAALKLLPLAIVGFLINLATGVCFIATSPFLYFTNSAFILKLFVLSLAGLNALWFTFAEYRTVVALPADAPAPMSARIMAGASLAMWVLILLLGRLLPTFASAGGG